MAQGILLKSSAQDDKLAPEPALALEILHTFEFGQDVHHLAILTFTYDTMLPYLFSPVALIREVSEAHVLRNANGDRASEHQSPSFVWRAIHPQASVNTLRR